MKRLTKREKWLMNKAFKAGIYSANNPYGYADVEKWLNAYIADNETTVEMVLLHEASKYETTN